MTYFYTVDRKKHYESGASIELKPIENHDNNEIVANLAKMYPKGLSEHGCFYVLSPNVSMLNINFSNAVAAANFKESLGLQFKGIAISAASDIIFELVRQAYYNDKPSRYQSMFAWETLKEAKEFRDDPKYRASGNNIFRVSSKNKIFHKADMSLLDISGSLACLLHKAHLYWQGQTLHIPDYQTIWEILVPLPAVVGEKCDA